MRVSSGDRPGTEVHWQANRHLWFQADYGSFLRGEIRQRESAGPQPQLLGIVGRLQVLGRSLSGTPVSCAGLV